MNLEYKHIVIFFPYHLTHHRRRTTDTELLRHLPASFYSGEILLMPHQAVEFAMNVGK